jgi:hypothetical protein
MAAMMFEPRCRSAVRLGPHRFPDDFVDNGKRFHGASAGLASAGADRPAQTDSLQNWTHRGLPRVVQGLSRPVVASDDGVAAGEPTECFNPNAGVMRPEALSRKEGHRWRGSV